MGTTMESGTAESLRQAVKLFNTIKQVYGRELDELDASGETKGRTAINGITEALTDAGNLFNNALKIVDPKKMEQARNAIASILQTITLIRSGKQDSAKDAIKGLMTDFRDLEKLMGITAKFGIKETNVKRFVDSLYQDREKLSKAAAEGRVKAQDILGIDFDEYQRLIVKAGELSQAYETATSKGKKLNKKDSKEIKETYDAMATLQAKMGEGIITTEWDDTFSRLSDIHKKILGIKQETEKPQEIHADQISNDADKAKEKLEGLETQARETNEAVDNIGDEPAAVQKDEKLEGEFERVEAQAEETTKVLAQMDDKFVDSINNMTNSLTDLVGKMDQLYDEAVKILPLFSDLDSDGRPPWADLFKETTGQSGIKDMNAGLEKLIANMDDLNAKAELTAKLLAAVAGVDLDVDAAQLQKALDALTKVKKKPVDDSADTLTGAVKDAGEAADQTAKKVVKISDAMAQTTKETQKLDKELNVVSGRVVGFDAAGNKVTATTDKDGNVTSAVVEKLNLDVEFDKLLKLKTSVDEAYQKLLKAIENGNTKSQETARGVLEKTRASLEAQSDKLVNITGSSKEFIKQMNTFRIDYAAFIGEWERKIAGRDEGKMIDLLKSKLTELYTLQTKALKSDGKNDFEKQIETVSDEVKKLKDELKDIIPDEAMAEINNLEAGLKDGFETAQTEATFRKMEAAIKDMAKAQNDLRTATKSGDDFGVDWANERVAAAKSEYDELVKSLDVNKLNE